MSQKKFNVILPTFMFSSLLLITVLAHDLYTNNIDEKACKILKHSIQHQHDENFQHLR